MRLDLRHIPAPPDLRPFVVGFVERRDEDRGEAALELPVHHSLVQFMLGADYEVAESLPGAVAETVPRAGLWGPASRTRVGRAEGPIHAFVVILTARGARAVSGVDLSQLVDRRLPLDAILSSREGSRTDRITTAATFEARAGLAVQWLRAVVARESSLPRAYGLADEIAEHRLRGPVSRLPRGADVSARGLHRLFTAQVGWPPKTWLRVVRLQRVLRAIHPLAWAGADEEDVRLEFTDDAHLARDFRDLTGISSAAYRRAKRQTGDPLLHTLLQSVT